MAVSDKKVVAVIPARGGSKGIPGKNIMSICGKPLLAWSIKHAQQSKYVESVWVTSDDDEILSLAKVLGAEVIKRPASLSGDKASSESAWIHALDYIEKQGNQVEFMIGMQATSPIRGEDDMDDAIIKMRDEKLDSLLSVCEVEDFFNWRMGDNGPESINYDYKDRKPRQAIETRYLENGSFYIFKPDLLRETKNRLAGKIGIHVMDKHKMFQIDNPEDVVLCEAILKGYGLSETFR
jgi:N-acylneuraminate cytidylyltransferase